MTKNTDQELITSLQNGDESAMDVLFRRHYKSICRSVYRILKDNNLAEDIAQEVFLGLWKKRDKLKITTSVQAYLKRTAVNKSLNFIRDQKIKFDDEEKMPVQYNNQSTSQQKLEADDLQNLINDSIDLLPEKCRLVFTLSRFEEMTYQEIAESIDETLNGDAAVKLNYIKSIEIELSKTH